MEDELRGYGRSAAGADSDGGPEEGGGGGSDYNNQPQQQQQQRQQQHSSAASAAAGGGGGRSKVQGWSSLTRLHRNPGTSSPPRNPFPPLATTTCSFSSKRSKNSRQLNNNNSENLQPPPVFGENFHRPHHSAGAGGVSSSSGSSFSSNYLPGRNLAGSVATSIPNGAAFSSNGRGSGRGGGVVGETDERRRRRVGSDSSSSSSDSFASNSFGQNGHVGGGGGGAVAGSTTAGSYYHHGHSGRSPPVSSAASYNNRVYGGGESGVGPRLSVFPNSSGIVVGEPVVSKNGRTVELSADAVPFVPAVKRGTYDQALQRLAGEAELSFLRAQNQGLRHEIEDHLHDDLGGGTNDDRDADVGSEKREPERPSVSDCRSSTGDAERDANGEAGAHAYDHGRDGGDSTAASSAFYVPMEPEWVEDDLYLRYRSDALRTARERDRFSHGASQAYMRGDHRRAKNMSKQAQEKRLLAERLNAEAANEILSQRNKDSSSDIWHIDLHGLHTGEAVAALENRLTYIESEVNSDCQADMREGSYLLPHVAHEVGETSNIRAHLDVKHKHIQSLITAPRELHVITGVGVHSQGGPTLPFAVKNFLLKNGYYFVQNTPGSISVRPKLRLSV